MVYYDVGIIKEGYNGKRASYGDPETVTYRAKTYTALFGIECDGDETTIEIPAFHEGFDEPLTHIGYVEGLDEAHEKWADWHHPSKGYDLIPDRYYLIEKEIKLPATVTRVVIPESVMRVFKRAFADGITIEVHRDNPYLTVENNKIIEK